MSENEKPLKIDIVHKADLVPKPQCLDDAERKKKRRNKSDLGENFIAPDGGWGWVVVIASGICILVTLPIVQQFGILFRERFKEIGISSAEMTTIINTQYALSALRGLFNGPLFRRFSYRQCAIAGTFFVFIGLLGAALANSFIWYLLTISFMYGIGKDLVKSSSSLAVNTYFKTKRRAATAYKFTVAGLGPIMLPYLSTLLIAEYSVAGAVLIYSGISLHNLACAIIYQPVKWHVKKSSENPEAGGKVADVKVDHASNNVTNLMTRENEERYSSKNSLDKTGRRHSCLRTMKSPEELNIEEQFQKKLSIFDKISIFFDLDLLKDATFVNLVMGLIVTSFTEANFSILTPFILDEFEFDNSQIAAAMSVLAACDMAIRFLIPFITSKMKFDNKVFFLAGIVGTIFGRAVVAHCRNFTVVLIAFAWMGLCNAMKIVFRNLIIPGYVPLNRLPAANGLQLLLSGIFTLICGPIIGLVRDATNYAVTLHWMNAVCFMVVIAWTLEDYFYEKKKQEKEQKMETIEDQSN